MGDPSPSTVEEKLKVEEKLREEVRSLQLSKASLIARVAALEDELEVEKEDRDMARENDNANIMDLRVQLSTAEERRLESLETIRRLEEIRFNTGEAAAKRNDLIKSLQAKLKAAQLEKESLSFPLKRFFVVANAADERFFSTQGTLPPGWARIQSKSRKGEYTFKNAQTGERIGEREVLAKMAGRRPLSFHSEERGIENALPTRKGAGTFGDEKPSWR